MSQKPTILDEFGLPIKAFFKPSPHATDEYPLPAIEERHATRHRRGSSKVSLSPELSKVSEWSHQITSPAVPDKDHVQQPLTLEDDGDWQDMPAIADHDIYDDESGKIIAHAAVNGQEHKNASGGKGYSRVQDDDDARSTDSVDEQTDHLFNPGGDEMSDEATVLSQMDYTKQLLTEGQRIAYVGICKIVIVGMLKDMTMYNNYNRSKGEGRFALEGLILWSQKTTVRMYQHMDISPAEQIMIEQLSEHGVLAEDLAPTLLAASRVKNPMSEDPPRSASTSPTPQSPQDVASPPYYESTLQPTVPEETISAADTKHTDKLDIDIRWTVLFDLFLILIADSVYDARSRVFLIRVAEVLGISYLEITKFEKKVTDALEVQEDTSSTVAAGEEQDMVGKRDKSSRNRRYMMMGLATLGGGLVIGLSAGLLAPVIGAGLGAAFTTVGVSGATGFLAGTSGAALITTGGVVTGSTIATRGMNRRTSSVKTFEFKPLFDNRRVNLLLTVPGWMAGKMDDVRLPFSTVDPIMGDICSVLWEPELLQTFQATGNILATEVLTQSLQQVLGQTVLTALMSALQWPLVLTKLSYLIDNPWSNSLDRAKAAGLILADSLVSRTLGVRPISLVGYSLGARVIYYALMELHRVKAYGIIENVYLFGAPVVVSNSDWRKARSVVAGRFVNGYVRNDWILGYLFRATSGGIGRVAGLRPVEEIEQIENIDVTDEVDGHMGYREAIPRLMLKIGYQVTSEEFQEIEDPDPDRQRERARELLEDIEDARKRGDKSVKKKRSFFGFGRKNLVTPDSLPTLATDVRPPSQDDSVGSAPNSGNNTPDGSSIEAIFDVEKIRGQLCDEQGTPSLRDMSKTLPTLPLGTKSTENVTMSFDIPHPPPKTSFFGSISPTPRYSPRPLLNRATSSPNSAMFRNSTRTNSPGFSTVTTPTSVPWRDGGNIEHGDPNDHETGQEAITMAFE